jgi:hypothetical protein
MNVDFVEGPYGELNSTYAFIYLLANEIVMTTVDTRRRYPRYFEEVVVPPVPDGQYILHLLPLSLHHRLHYICTYLRFYISCRSHP